MANEKQTVLSEEYLRKFRHRAGYVINESPKYRPLVNDDEEFDNIPMLTTEAGEQEDAPKPEGQVPPAPSNDVPQGETPESPVPAFDAGADPMGGDPMGAQQDPMANPMGNPDPMGANPENQVDDIQNEIIKHNIEAMKSIHDQLESLNSTIQGLNTKVDGLSADVEEVREPTNSEKLMSKTNVSYPYYFNLNDFWQGNWFNEKRDSAQEKGIKELPDGTYVADFDDLPQKSKMDVQKSFNEINESTNKKKIMSEGFRLGMKVQVSDGSGLDSNKMGTVVSPREVKTDGRGTPTNVSGAYKPVDWSRETAVRLEDGSLITMFNNRLKSI